MADGSESSEDHFSDAQEENQAGKEARAPTSQKSLSISTNVSPSSSPSSPIPTLRVEKVDPDTKSHGEVEGTDAYEVRKADAEPDEVALAPDVTRQTLEVPRMTSLAENTEVEGDDFDDFDDFEEGVDTFEAPRDTARPIPIKPLDLNNEQDIIAALQPYLDRIFPNSSTKSDETIPEPNPTYFSERSQSLWEQLVAPPPLQPPDWKRSRIRRLFLISLGVPVDLDEILPASKQKKLILPHLDAEKSPGSAIERLKRQAARPKSRTESRSRRKGPPPPPELDLNAARLLCTTTDAALSNLTDDELREHVDVLDHLRREAYEMLEYWLIQKDSANGDKEAFEEVIENLVKHAKKVRK